MGDKGERVRYFQDDDKLGLKDMVRLKVVLMQAHPNTYIISQT